jgi:hypothetical protein
MSKKTPAAPDPAKQVAAQSAANLDTAIANAYINNPNIVSPYGNVSSVQTGTQKVGGKDVPIFTQTTSLTPSQQRQLDMTDALQEQALGIGSGVLKNVGDVTSKPFTLEGLPDAPGSGDFSADRDKITQSLIDRNQSQMDRTRGGQETQLRNQGIVPGSEAWKNAMDDIARQENDFNLGAIQAGGAEQSRLFGLSDTARKNAISEAAYTRSQPINEYATLLGLGGQVEAPNIQYSNSNVANTDVYSPYSQQYAGKMAGYNAKQQMYGNLIGAAGNVGAAAMMPAAVMSDVRTKENIKFVGNEGMFPIYHFSYLNDPEKNTYRGVMAQDVQEIMPDAVIAHNGVLAVDYAKIGVEFGRVN